ncbi:MAG: hypothetical protein RMJ51_03650 [Candidatus Calescibacterium sp.]|nr:hypothetical protein [Candidatus Calescibacterium sp.]MCX7971713.1 hypothetical protein [bacterium]MDW8195319.1 hypothetical protein [Candidatus Calescibacterium sp.]
MVVVFPAPITQFLNILETILYFSNYIEDDLEQVLIDHKDIFVNFLDYLSNQIVDDWRLAQITLPLDPNFVNSVQKNIDKLPDLLEKIKEKIDDISLNNIDSSTVEETVKYIVEIIRLNNVVSEILKNQKFLSSYPVVDRFLKIFWMYIESIKDLENFPVDLLTRYMFGTLKTVEELEKQINEESKILEVIKDVEKREEISKIISQQASFIEAMKYALGAAYELITGGINLIEDPELPSKIFIQINQASNTFFILEKKKAEKISVLDIVDNYQNLDLEKQDKVLSFVKNNILRIILDPAFINNIIKRNLEIEDVLRILKISDISDFVSYKEILIKFLDEANSIVDKDPESDSKIEKELINAISLVLMFNLPVTTLINMLLNVKSTLRIFTILNVYKTEKIDNNSKTIEDLIIYLLKYTIYPDILEDIYITFLNFLKGFREIYREMELMISQNVVCPACSTQNDFFSTKCANCNFPFPISVEKLLITNLQHSPAIIQNYVLGIIDNYIIKKQTKNVITQLENTIKELSNLAIYFDKNNKSYEVDVVSELIQIIQEIRDDIENGKEEREIFEKILKFLEYVQPLNSWFEKREV